MPFELKTEHIEKKKVKKATKLDAFMYRYSFLVLIIILGFILAAGSFLVLKPKYEDIMLAYEQEYNKKKNDLLILKKNEENLTRYILDYKSITEEEKSVIEKMIPEENQYELVYAEMDKMIRDRGLVLKKIKVMPVEEDEKVKKAGKKEDDKLGKISVEMIIEGMDYDGFKRLLSSLERNMKILDIQKVSFRPDQFTTNITLHTYYSKL